MTRQQFVLVFIALAVCFVPIVIYFGLVAFVVPTCWGLVAMIDQIMKLEWRLTLGYGIYSALYILLFYLTGRGLYFVINLVPNKKSVIFLQGAVFLALFSCSFARVITYDSYQGGGGTYTFWSAVERYLEKRNQ